MAGFDDLVRSAQPRVCNVRASGIPGSTWTWVFTDVNDFTGTPIDLTACTAVCKCVDVDGTVLFDGFTVTLGVGTFTVSATAAATGALTALKRTNGQWFLSLALSGQTAQVWGPDGSPFLFEWAGA